MTSSFQNDSRWAQQQDAADPLHSLRNEFLFPPGPNGQPMLYFAGHSLGLQPKRAREYVNEVLDDWAQYGVEGHFAAKHSWMPYHELLTASTARLVGALPSEVVVMNTLTVNLHLAMVSFYRPTDKRFRLIVEAGAFPSDQYAVASQARFHGYAPEEAVVEIKPRPGEFALRSEDVLATIEKFGDSTALIMLGNPNYLSGQVFDFESIVKAGHEKGCVVGFDLAHGAGNLLLKLHDWNVDFAVWCNYKYLNAGPGGLGGMFVHERHANDSSLPRFSGWWGHDKATRFKMGPEFKAIAGAEGWQLSNPPILQMAALRASMELFEKATMERLRAKGDRVTAYLEWLVSQLPTDRFTLLTPKNPSERGSMLTLRVRGAAELVEFLLKRGANVDLRNPDIVRITPVPLYCGFEDVQRLAALMAEWCAHAE